MAWTDLTAARARSTSCFGQQYRLELMVAIAEDHEGVVNLKDLAGCLGVASGTLQKSVKNLAAIGMLEMLPRGDSRKVHYRRVDSAGWDFALELAADFRLDDASANPARPTARPAGLAAPNPG